MLWDSGFTHSINTYFYIYTPCKPLEKGDDKEVNGIRGIINQNGMYTVVLDLKYETGKIHDIYFKRLLLPWSSQAPHEL